MAFNIFYLLNAQGVIGECNHYPSQAVSIDDHPIVSKILSMCIDLVKLCKSIVRVMIVVEFYNNENGHFGN